MVISYRVRIYRMPARECRCAVVALRLSKCARLPLPLAVVGPRSGGPWFPSRHGVSCDVDLTLREVMLKLGRDGAW